MNNDFIVNTRAIKNIVDNIKSQQLLKEINDTFHSIETFNNNWNDIYSKNSDIFKDKMKLYNNDFLELYQELITLKEDIEEQMNKYEQIEKSATNWE